MSALSQTPGGRRRRRILVVSGPVVTAIDTAAPHFQRPTGEWPDD